MAELRVRVPDDLSEDMRKHSDIEWSKVFERAAKEELAERARRQLVLSALNKLLGKSKLTEHDALVLGRKVNEEMYRELKAKGLV